MLPISHLICTDILFPQNFHLCEYIYNVPVQVCKGFMKFGSRYKAEQMEVSIMMQAQDVLEVIHQLERAGVASWLDGGWGVDALLGRQTRSHDDVDVIITLEQARLAEETLCFAGYVVTEDERPTRFVMRDSQGRSIDFHPVTFDQQGDRIQRLPDGTGFHYPRKGFVR